MRYKMEHYGKTAFNAYKVKVGGVTFDGRSIPDWEDLTDVVRAGWTEAAHFSIVRYLSECHALVEDTIWTE